MDNSPRSNNSKSNTHTPQKHRTLPRRMLSVFNRDSRGQTSIDLVLGVMIFFSAVALLTVQSPGLFFPGDLGSANDMTTSDRAAIELTSNLSENGDHELSHAKVVDFLDDDEPNLEDAISIPDDRDAEVTLSTPAGTDRGPPTALNPEQTDYNIDDDGDTYSVTKGDAQDQTGTTVTVNRTLNDRPVTIEVTITN